MTDPTPVPPVEPTPPVTPPVPPVPPVEPPAAVVVPPVEPAAAAAAPAPAYPTTAYEAPIPGKTLGIVAIPVAIFFSVIGIILGFVAKSQSKRAGHPNTPAVIAIVIGFVSLAISLLVGILLIAGFVALIAQCANLDSGVYQTENGSTLTCS